MLLYKKEKANECSLLVNVLICNVRLTCVRIFITFIDWCWCKLVVLDLASLYMHINQNATEEHHKLAFWSMIGVLKYDWWSLCKIILSRARNLQQLFSVEKKNNIILHQMKTGKHKCCTTTTMCNTIYSGKILIY